MKIPSSKRKKALFVIDVQDEFLDARNRYIIEEIKSLLENTEYDLYVEAIFYAEKGSIWDLQQHWTAPKSDKTKTVDSLANILRKYKALRVEKDSRSVFKGNNNTLHEFLKQNSIEEIHIVGTQTNDCVFATALESSDLGFFTYVIEECCETANEDLQKHGIALLRRQNLTNNSVVEELDFKTV